MGQKQGSGWHSVLIEATYWIRNHMKHIQRQHSMEQTLLTCMQLQDGPTRNFIWS